MKRFMAVFIIAASALLFCSCGVKSSKPVYAFNVDTLAQAIAERTTFKDELVSLDSEKAAALYQFGEDKIAAYAGSGATAEVVIVTEYSDEAAAESGLTLMKNYIEKQKTLFTDYNASELPKLENALCGVYGKYAVCVVSPDNSEAEKVITEQSTEG